MNFIGKKFNNGWHGVANLEDTIGSQNFVGRGSYLFMTGETREIMCYEAKTLTKMQGISSHHYLTIQVLLGGRDLCFSPDCSRIVIGGNAFANDGMQAFDTKTFDFSNPYHNFQTAQNSNTILGCSFSTNGSYFATANNGTKVYVYNVPSDISSQWTNVANFTFTGASVCSTAFSPNGTWFAAGGAKDTSTNEYVKVYAQSDFSTAISLSAQPAGKVFSVAFNPGSTLMACAHTTTPYLTVYDTGASFTKKADVSSLPAGNATGVQFSPDGAYLIISHATTPFQTIYKVSDWSKLASPFSAGPAGVGVAGYSPDGTMLAVSSSSSPFFMLYDISGETYTRRTPANPSETFIPSNFAWLQNGQTYAL